MSRTSMGDAGAIDLNGMIDGLAALIGRENVLFARRDLLAYSYDAEEQGRGPDAVVFPPTTADIARVVGFCAGRGVSVVVRGAGTNLSGGTIPVRGGVVLEISRLQAIRSISLPDRRMVAEVGAVNLDLQNEVAKAGYSYAPDPASQKVSTLGGNLGENAGGPHCFKYGVTSNHVLGAEVVLADGSVAHLGGSLEDNPGYDLTGLFVGSEGTLGIATTATLKITPAAESIRTLLVVFDRLADAGAAVAAIVAAGLVPATLELMDNGVIRAVEASGSYGFPIDAAAILLIEVDGLDDGLDRQVADVEAICRAQGAREARLAKSAAERDALWAGRRGALGSIARIAKSYVTMDGTVPRTGLAEVLTKLGEIGARHRLGVCAFAHAGDGNLHPVVMFDPRDPDEVARLHAASADIMRECVDAGGTLTGEHGVGISKRDYMPILFGEPELRLFGRIKRAFDPDSLMNPGKVLPTEMPADTNLARPASSSPSALAMRLVGTPEGLLSASPDRYAVGGLRPVAAFQPRSVEATRAAVVAAAEAGVPVVPWGHGGQQATGRMTPTDCLVLDLSRLDRIVEIDRGNQTVDVQAGVTLGELQSELAKHGLFLPVDPDGVADMTIGGLVATAAAGPRRLAYGQPRDLVLGLRVITPSGETVRLGGRTMKDVAGYDARKLYVGSWGTLGVIVEATLRLFPLPEISKTLVGRFGDPASAGAAVRTLLASPLPLSALEMVNGAALALDGGADGAWRTMRLRLPTIAAGDVLLIARLEGRREAVARLERDVTARFTASGASALGAYSGDAEAATWAARSGLATRVVGSGAASARFSVPISRVADLIAALPASTGLVVHAGSGVGRAFFGAGCDQGAGFSALRSAAESLGGFALLEHASASLLEAHGDLPARDDYPLMRRLRAAIDPNGLFNPGRQF